MSRPVLLSVVFFAGLACLPLFADDFILSLLTLVLMYAFFGQAWNLMMGYAGQLSLGHALFIGIGAYTTAILSERYGVSPWLGIVIGMFLSAAAGTLVAVLGFRFAVRGIYFALLTIAAAEFTRVLFDNWSYVGGTGGFFLRAVGGEHPLIALRGGTEFFYFAFLVLAALAFALSAWLVSSRLGYLWRAIREDEEAARALGAPVFRLKVIVVVISAAMTSAGGSMLAMLSGSLFPDTIMGMRMSIEVIVAPIIGELGTLFGPFVGALFIIPVMELSNVLAQQSGIFGFNTFLYGCLVILVIRFLPEGLWPPLARVLFRFGSSSRLI